MYFKNVLLVVGGFIVLGIATGCSNQSEEKQPEVVKKDNKTVPPTKKTERAPIINMTDTLSVKRIVVCIKDSAATSERISMKLGLIYGVKMASILKKNKLRMTGPPMAWYKSRKAPFFFDAGIPVDKKPAKIPANVQVRTTGGDSATVAHYYGPYDMIGQAYEAVSDWLKEHNKTVVGSPYEIYVDDPIEKNGKLKDPYKVQTDIVFPWK
jgi:effector-binding domain-containing protein